MSAKDLFHNTVKRALEKDGWTITDEHIFIQVEDVDFYIDLTAERILAAEKTGQKIAVEVKSFLGASDVISLPVASELYVIMIATAVERRIYAHAQDASLRFSSFATLTDSA